MGLLAVGYLGMIFALRPVMAVVALGLGALQVLVFSMTKQQYRRLMAEDLESQAKAQAYLTQILAGIETLKASGAEHRAVEHWSNLFVDELNVSIRRGSLNALIVSFKTSSTIGFSALDPQLWSDARHERRNGAGDHVGDECARRRFFDAVIDPR